MMRSTFRLEIMFHKKFLDILKYPHFVDNEPAGNSSVAEDRPWKIRPFVQRFLSKFKTLFNPRKEPNLDESICSYKARVTFHC